jgi:paraquat-inducible protein A
MKIRLQNEDELDEYIICRSCHTLQRRLILKKGSKAECVQCHIELYKQDSRLIEHGLAWSVTGLIFFILANSFPLLQIEMVGSENFLSIGSMILSLFESGYYLVGLFVGYLIFIFPLMIFVLYILIFSLMLLKRGKVLTKELLTLLGELLPWHMSDIFLISILVAIVKLFALADIQIGISFWALIAFVLINLSLSKTLRIGEIWLVHKRIFGVSGGSLDD